MHRNPSHIKSITHLTRCNVSWVKRRFLLLGAFIMPWLAQGQVVQDSTDLSTEVIQVIKSYAPEIADAFKIKQMPDFEENVIAPEASLNYTVLSVPATTDFVMTRPQPMRYKSASDKKPYDNYVRIWGGTKESLGLDLNTKLSHSKKQLWSIGLQHEQINGPLPGISWGNDWSFSKFNSDLRLINRERELSFSFDLSQRNNVFYGISSGALFDEGLFDLDWSQSLTQTAFKATLGANGGWFDGGSMDLSYLRDRFDTSEFSFNAKPQAHFLIGSRQFLIKANLGLLNTIYTPKEGAATEYRFMNHDLEGTYSLAFDALLIDFGAKVWWHTATSAQTEVRVFPNIHLTYPLIKNVMQLEGIFGGAYAQQSYRDFQYTNNWLAPNALLKPTISQQFLDVTLSGAWSKQVHYQLGARWDQIEDLPLMVRSEYAIGVNQAPYDYGNSFDVIYDQAAVFKLHYGLSADVNDQWQIGARGSWAQYAMDRESTPWNLPELSMAFDAHFRYSAKWSLSAQLLAYGSREDRFVDLGQVRTEEVSGFIDLGATLRHQITKKWMASIMINNALNQDYQLWTQYPVQGFRINLGIQYNFDLP